MKYAKNPLSYLLSLAALLGALLLAPAAVAQEGRVTLPIVDDPLFNQLHPNAFVESVMVNRVLFNGLVKLGKDFDTAADLAETWEASADGLVWTFHLRDDVTWHDGEPFTSDDVIFTFEEVILNPEVGANNARIYANVEDVVAVDGHTVEFHLASPFASLGVNLAYNTPILPAHILRGTDVMNNNAFNRQNPVGTGPFMLAEYVPGQRVVLERFDDYFLGGPQLDEVVYEIIPDPNSQLARLLAGELDLMIIDNPITTQRLRTNEALEITTSNQLNYYWAGPNLSRSPFDRKEFRQALSYAIDREVMIDNTVLGFARPATGPISPVLQSFYTDDVQTYPYDPGRARELLEQAGFTFDDDGTALFDGEPFTFTITYPNVQVFGQVATLLQQYFRDIGITAELQGLEFNSFVSEALVPRDFDMLLGWWVTPPDPDIFPYYHSSAAEGGNNATMYRSEEADELLELGRETSDPQERVQIYHELQRLLAVDLPMIYLWYPDEIVAMDANLEGVPEAIGYRPALQYIHEWSMK